MRHLSVCVEEEKIFLAIDLDFMTNSEKEKLVAHIQNQAANGQCAKEVAVSAVRKIQASLNKGFSVLLQDQEEGQENLLDVDMREIYGHHNLRQKRRLW